MIRALAGMVTAAGGKIITGGRGGRDPSRRRPGDRRAAGIRRGPHGAAGSHRRRRARVPCPAGCCRHGSRRRPASTRAMRKFRHAPGTMMIHLALDDLPDWRAGAGAARLRLCPSRAVARSDGANLSAGDRGPAARSSRCWWSASRRRSIRPARRPASMCCGCRCGCCRARCRATRPATSRRGHWDEIKDGYADRVIDMIESYAPGLRAKILARAVFSPHDLERENPNLVGGDQLCGSHHLAQNFMFRPARRLCALATRRSPAFIWSGRPTGRAPGWVPDQATSLPTSLAGT